MVERVLVIRLGALGDLVLCFQAFHEIRQAHPGAEIALLTMPAFADFARGMPWFDKVICDPRAPFFRIDQWAALAAKLWRFAPTRVYDLQGKFRQDLLYALLGGPLGREWSGAAPLCRFPRLWPPAPGMHFTDFVAAQLRAAGVPAAGPANLGWLDAPVDDLKLPERFALVVPGCAPGREYKRWPAKKFAALADRLAATGIHAVLAGTWQDRDAIEAIRAEAPLAIDLSGKTSLYQLAGVMRHALYVIGNDTGPVHLAAAIGAPTLALMSEAVDPAWSAPRGPRAAFLQGRPLAQLPVEGVLAALGPPVKTA